jgi:hypothetical protein
VKKILLYLVVGVGVLAGIVGLGALAGPPTPANRDAGPTAAPSPQLDTGGPTPQWICKVSDDGGTYYLKVTSALAGNVSACRGAPEAFGSNIDTLLQQPHMDRRCILPTTEPGPGLPDALPTDEAIVGVYSDTARRDLAAARSYCETWKGQA